MVIKQDNVTFNDDVDKKIHKDINENYSNESEKKYTCTDVQKILHENDISWQKKMILLAMIAIILILGIS